MSEISSSNNYNKIIPTILFSTSIIFVISILVICDGTSDSGDSIQHYMFAKWAPVHPELYFNHWAKPVFTLLSSPFSQFGFIGMKVFNALIALFAIILTYLSAKELKLKYDFLVIPAMTFSTIFISTTFSGLTEPLFACWLIASVYLLLKKKFLYAAILISFLSFIRTEGLFFIAIFGFYFLLRKENWKYIPFLMVGNVVYSIVGYFWTKDLLWVIHANPYAGVDQAYGTGSLFHFFGQLIYILGIPVFVLFLLGLISSVYFLIKKDLSKEYIIIVLGGFACFFLAHSIFWFYGIFGSMGLTRVFMAVIPLMIIIAVYSGELFQKASLKFKPIYTNSLLDLVIGFVMLFPFLKNPASVDWEKHMFLSADQTEAQEVADFVRSDLNPSGKIVFSHPYLAEVLDIDPFDHDSYRLLKPKYLNEEIKVGDVLIWDNWFCTIQFQLGLRELMNDKRLAPVNYDNDSPYEEDNFFAVFVVKQRAE